MTTKNALRFGFLFASGLIAISLLSINLVASEPEASEFLPVVIAVEGDSEATITPQASPTVESGITATAAPTASASPSASATAINTATPTATNTPEPLPAPELLPIFTDGDVGPDYVLLRWNYNWVGLGTVPDYALINAWKDETEAIVNERHETTKKIQVGTPEDGLWCFELSLVGTDGRHSLPSNRECHIAGPTAIWAPLLGVRGLQLGELKVSIQKTNGGWYHELRKSLNGSQWVSDETEPDLSESSPAYLVFFVPANETGEWCFQARWHNQDRTETGEWGQIACEIWGPYGAPASKPRWPDVWYDAPLDYINVVWELYHTPAINGCWGELQEQYEAGSWVTVYSHSGCTESKTKYQHENPGSGEYCYRVRQKWNDEAAQWSEWSEPSCVIVP